ncbi:MAG: hypothetical protein QF415_07620 [Candidatus Undinarchaeales archaeon]|jgi:hypothetical protein|nr:hypothetical protein [Candidatus Undinarchaeales archaeon]MDP7492333.1 hypothetical protein [Candidatus Undinarchaeales archaeon]
MTDTPNDNPATGISLAMSTVSSRARPDLIGLVIAPPGPAAIRVELDRDLACDLVTKVRAFLDTGTIQASMHTRPVLELFDDPERGGPVLSFHGDRIKTSLVVDRPFLERLADFIAARIEEKSWDECSF